MEEKSILNKFTVSLICMDMSDIKSDVDSLLDNGINHVHADFMDNTFVPRLGISPELIKWLKERYGNNISIDSHLMVQNPFQCIDKIAPYSDWVFIHMEATPDPVRTLQKIRQDFSNVKIGCAYNLGTDINMFLSQLGLQDGCMFMGISPGVLGTNSWPDVVFDKIRAVRAMDKGANVFVDGGVNFKSIRTLTNLADMMVCGSSTVFKVDDFTKNMNRSDMINFNINRMMEIMQ